MGNEPLTGLALLVDVLGNFWTGITTLVTDISSNALLLIPLAGVFAGIVIGLTMKLMGLRRKRR